MLKPGIHQAVSSEEKRDHRVPSRRPGAQDLQDVVHAPVEAPLSWGPEAACRVLAGSDRVSRCDGQGAALEPRPG